MKISTNDTKGDKIINLNDFILQDKVGNGSFAKVYRIREKSTGEIYAAKVSIDEIDDNNDLLTNLSREVNIISNLNHPSVLRFIGFCPIDFKKRHRPVIITEYASNGSLKDLIVLQRNSPNLSIFDDTRKLIILYGIASAMSYLHSHNIIHRDLKPGNILIDEFYLPKIADFGLSKIKYSNLNSIAKGSVDGVTKGTPIYMSPEIWEKSEYSPFSDVYAFSMIVYEIITNEQPFNDLNLHNLYLIPLKIKSGYRPPLKKSIPGSYRKLITSCWAFIPSTRPTFNQIMNQLKTSRGFITEKVNESEFFKYVNLIDNYNKTFDTFKAINFSNLYKRIPKKKGN